MMNGIRISDEKNIIQIIKSKKIDTFIVALDDDVPFDKKRYVKLLFEFNISLLNFDNNNNFSNISNQIDIDSLLFRNEVYTNLNINLSGETILVTGGAGSIGSEICFQLLKYNPSEILVLDNSEFNLFKLNQKLNFFKNEGHINTKISLNLCDISNIEEITHIIKDKKIDRVFHCAAFKHVPIVEDNMYKALKNNFLSTHNLLKLLLSENINKFTFISSDKAVRPTNIMGATKRLAEMAVLYLNKTINHNSKISIVRFGNVLESSGSVVPEFRDQILGGGPVTVTHPEITRFFMSLEEAALLVIQSSQLSESGETFLLDMGDPIKINDLAKKMIKLSGKSLKKNHKEAGDIEIIYTGLRPGEKLYEELLVNEKSRKTSHKFIFQSIEDEIDNTSYEILYRGIVICLESRDSEKLKFLLNNKFIEYKNDYDA
jgi:FlaA1/EpsC-like NDP-sugar epimerase